MTLNNADFFFLNPIFVRVNFPTHICLRKNWQSLLTLTHRSYSKYKGILHRLNVYKITETKLKRIEIRT